MTLTADAAAPQACTRRLAANLQALARTSPDVAELIGATPPRPDLEFSPGADGGLAARLEGKALGSQRRPLEEARRLAETYDPHNAATALILGFGLGHHVQAIAERVGRQGVLVVYEPDVGLLRAVLERAEHAWWIRRTNLILLTDPDDTGAMSAALHRVSAALAMGVTVVAHPPSARRLGETARRFTQNFTKSLAAIRTTVVTTLVQSDITYRNGILNARRYVESAGVADLHNLCAGSPAITVSAGPSLRRNMHLLKAPDVRERCVIIAAQTVLKQLLREGIRPHFVTALDFHEISRRFYEGLTAEDVEGVTLIAEPKANPAILEAFPGQVRCPGDLTLNTLLGESLAGDHGALKSGSTVAHLSYHLARHLGCDPVIMIGQDLGFTDGQYYAKGAAIHDVWAGELNEFNTLEMMEWVRIARNRRTLHRGVDHLGRPIYTDEQMTTYLAAFERAFHADAANGGTIIDATEGGLKKGSTRIMSLREALDAYASIGARRLPDLSAPPPPAGRVSMDRVDAHVRDVRRDVGRIVSLSRETERLLDEMVDRCGDDESLNRLIRKAHKLRDEVHSLKPAYELIQRLNQMGMFKRARADRDIALTEDLPPREKQKRQIERDRENVRWIAEAGEELARMLDDALTYWSEGGGRAASEDAAAPGEAAIDIEIREAPTRRVAAVIPVDFDRSSLGTPRDLGAPLAGRNALQWTLARLSRSRLIDAAVLLTDEPERALALAGPAPQGLSIETVRTSGPPMRARTEAVRGARLWAPACWRGGLGGFTCYDEVLAAAHVEEALHRVDRAGALLVGADWALVDPALCDAAAARFLEREDGHKLAFTQAPPGLAGAVIERKIVRDLGVSDAGVHASVGRLLGYVPTQPASDPIAHRVCAPISAAVRDTLERFIPDEPSRAARIGRILQALGDEAETAPAVRIAEVARGLEHDEPAPQQATLELTTRRVAAGLRLDWLTGGASLERGDLDLAAAERIIGDLASARRDAALTLAGVGDPLLHPQWERIIAMAREAGVAGVHVRTDLQVDAGTLDRLIAAAPDVVSVDVLANTAATHQALTDADGFRTVLENIDRLMQARRDRGGLPTPWIVPRITRCDDVYEEIEPFFDKWMVVTGAAVIDPLPCEIPGARIGPLGLPDATRRRDARQCVHVRSDGVIEAPAPAGEERRELGRVDEGGALEVWRRAQAPAALQEA